MPVIMKMTKNMGINVCKHSVLHPKNEKKAAGNSELTIGISQLSSAPPPKIYRIREMRAMTVKKYPNMLRIMDRLCYSCLLKDHAAIDSSTAPKIITMSISSRTVIVCPKTVTPMA